MQFAFGKGVEIASLSAVSLPAADGRFETVPLDGYLNTGRFKGDTIKLEARGKRVTVGGVPFVAVSVDPAGDTRPSARAFLLKHDLNSRAHFLMGTVAQLEPVWREFGVAPQRSGSSARDDHTISTVLLDARGVQRIGFRADDLTPEGVAHDVRRLER